MIIDANAWIGHFPFRPLPSPTPEGLIRCWDRHRIDRGVVQSLNAVSYRNAHNGNVELFRALKPFRTRTILFGTVNPAYAAWEDDWTQCVEEFGIQGVNLHPHHHGYGVEDPRLDALLARAARAKLPVALTVRFEDPRQRHRLDHAPELEMWEMNRLIVRHPGVSFIVHNASDPLLMVRELRGMAPRARQVLFTNAFVWGAPERRDARFIHEAGSGALALGTHWPFRYAASAIIKADLLDLPERDRRAVLGGNLLGLLP